MYLIGLDVGTTGCKAAIFTADGALVSSVSREYSVDIPQKGWAEQDAENVWRLVQEALCEAVAHIDGERRVAAIGLSVQGEAVMPVDQNGRAMRHAILGMDTRTGEQNRQLDEKFGREHLFQRTGMPLHTINTLPKLLWLKQYEPDCWKTATRFLLYEDFLIQKMTGIPAISRCLASRTQLYDLLEDKWSDEILEWMGLEPGRLSPVYPSGSIIGEVKAELVEDWGLANRPLVVTGGHDQACGALGVGLTKPGLSMVSTGTAEVVEVVLGSPALNQTLEQGNISCYAHVAPALYLAMTLNHSGGLLLRWFRDVFCSDEVRQAAVIGKDAYDLIFGDLSDEPSPLLLLPHFSGSGTPWFDTESKGAILGLTFAATKKDFARAILEGLTYELKINLELLRKGGVLINELRAIGGGARSRLWLQLKADITDIRVAVPQVTEAASWGAALLAGAGAGIFADVAQAAEDTLKIVERYEPNPNAVQRYAERFELYQQVYPTLADLNHHL